MKSFEQLGQVAYEVYLQHALEFTHVFAGAPIWAELNAENKECWIAAAKALVAELQSVH